LSAWLAPTLGYAFVAFVVAAVNAWLVEALEAVCNACSGTAKVFLNRSSSRFIVRPIESAFCQLLHLITSSIPRAPPVVVATTV
jgi:hypothetical protein